MAVVTDELLEPVSLCQVKRLDRWLMVRAANMKITVDTRDGRIVNISSISAYTSSTSRGEYCVSKAGISMVTQLFADRLAEAGAQVGAQLDAGEVRGLLGGLPKGRGQGKGR